MCFTVQEVSYQWVRVRDVTSPCIESTGRSDERKVRRLSLILPLLSLTLILFFQNVSQGLDPGPSIPDKGIILVVKIVKKIDCEGNGSCTSSVGASGLCSRRGCNSTVNIQFYLR